MRRGIICRPVCCRTGGRGIICRSFGRLTIVLFRCAQASGLEIPGFWPGLFVGAMDGQDMAKLVTAMPEGGGGGGGGGGDAPAAAAPAAGMSSWCCMFRPVRFTL